MSRLYTAGAVFKETIPVSGYSELTLEGFNHNNEVQFDGTKIRYKGVGSYKFGLEGVLYVTHTMVATHTVYVRGYIYYQAFPSEGHSTACIEMFTDKRVGAWVSHAGELFLGKEEGVKIGTGGKALSLNTWYRVELSYKAGSTVEKLSEVELRCEGVKVESSATEITSTDTFNRLAFGDESGWSDVFNVDDIAINNSEGTKQNTWPGAGYAIAVMPASDGTRSAEWKTGAGGTAELFKAIANRPPIGKASASKTATSQLECKANNATEAYTANLETYATAGVTSGDKIMVAQIVASQGNSSTTAISESYTGTNPTIAEATVAGTTTAAGAFPTGWTSSRSGVVYPEEAIAGTPTIKVIKKTASNTIEGYVDLMAMVVEAQHLELETLERTAADTITTSSVASGAELLARGTADTLATSSAATVTELGVHTADTIAVASTAIVSGLAVKTADTITTSSVASGAENLARATADTISTSSVAIVKELGVHTADTVAAISSTAAPATEAPRTASDTITTSSLAAITELGVHTADTITTSSTAAILEGGLRWFTAPLIPLIEGSSLATAFEVTAGEYEVELTYIRVKLGQSSVYIQTKAATYGPLVESWSEIAVAPFAECRFSVAVRENHFTNLYGFYVERNGAWFLLKLASGVESKIAEGTLSSALEVHDKLAIRAVGNKISCAVKHAGITTVVHELEDSSVTSAGAVAFSLKESGTAIGEFGGGTPEGEGAVEELSRTCGDTVTVSSTAVVAELGVHAGDSVSTSSVAAVTQLGTHTQDTVTTSSTAAVTELATHAADTVTTSSTAAVTGLAAHAGDTISTSSTAAITELGAHAGDTVTTSSTAVRATLDLRVIGDTVTLASIASVTETATHTADTITLSSVATGATEGNIQALTSDTITVSSVAAIVETRTHTADTVTISSTALAATAMSRTVSDTVTLSSFAIIFNLGVHTHDAISVSSEVLASKFAEEWQGMVI